MEIIRFNETYLDKLVPVLDDYRIFCGFDSDENQTRLFLKGLIARNDSVIFIAFDEMQDKVAGFINLYPSYSTLSLKKLWILNDLGVSKDYRKKGVSKRLIKKTIEFAKETGAIRLELKTSKDNIRARNLYSSLGFKIDDKNIYYRVPIEI